MSKLSRGTRTGLGTSGFDVRNRQGFLSLFHLLPPWSGGQLDIGRLARLSGLSRPTVGAYLEALQIAHAVHLVRPFHGGGRRKIVARPKCYAFDTGFVTFEKGWHALRAEDRGVLWEHLVLTPCVSGIPATASSTGATRPAGKWTSLSGASGTAWTSWSAR